MTPALRKLVLTAHVTSSVGWLGAVAGFQALAIAAATSQEPQAIRSFYLAMGLIGWYVVVPFCLASLVTGLVISLGTAWGLFRHYWVLVKFLITVIAALILFGFTETLALMGDLADRTLDGAELRTVKQSPVLHSGGGLLALLITTVLAVYKPWGLTLYGRRKLHSTGDLGGPSLNTAWLRYLLLGSIGLVLLFLVLHLIGGGPKGH